MKDWSQGRQAVCLQWGREQQRVWLGGARAGRSGWHGTGAGRGSALNRSRQRVWLGWGVRVREVSVPVLSPVLTPHSSQAVRKPLVAEGRGLEVGGCSCVRVWPNLPPLPLLRALGARDMIARAAGEAPQTCR